MATTYNFTDGSIAGAYVPAETTLIENQVVVRRNIVDFSLQTIDVSETDVVRVINVPANTTVLTAGARVITAETASSEFDIGYGGNVDQWGDGVSMATANVTVGCLDAPVYFAAADTIDITSSGSVDYDGGKIEVFALMLKHTDTL